MRVRFAPEALAEPEAWSTLDDIVKLFLEKRHLWDVDDPRAVVQSAWISSEPASRAGRRNQDALRKAMLYGTYRGRAHPMTLVVSMVGSPPHSLLPEDALRALQLPAFVVVENAESDKAFLASMMRTFGRNALDEALRRGHWEIISAGGGGEIPKRVNECLAKIGEGPRRVLILSDSDRLLPSERTKTVEKINQCAADHSVSAVILNKREIENYIPYDALWDQGKNRERCNAFLLLSQRGRDHYDMKRGFGRDPETKEVVIPEAQRALYEGVRPRRVLDDLVGGFGGRVWECFASDKVTESAIRALCSEDEEEIPRLLHRIEEIL